MGAPEERCVTIHWINKKRRDMKSLNDMTRVRLMGRMTQRFCDENEINYDKTAGARSLR